jgi:hypothetical protein
LEVDFDTDAYVNQWVWTTGGATHRWEPNGGWRGGAARFTPPTIAQQYSGLGQFTGFNTSNAPFKQINVRFLIYHGSTYGTYTEGGKLLILNRVFEGTSNQAMRAMIIENHFRDSEWSAYGACANTVCNYETGDYWANGNETFRIGNGPMARHEEWISIEAEANIETGQINLYVHTQDGLQSGLLTSQNFQFEPDAPVNPTNTVWAYLDILGGYWNEAIPADPNNYFMFDELKIDTQYIGPPAGFLNDPPPGAPSGAALR